MRTFTPSLTRPGSAGSDLARHIATFRQAVPPAWRTERAMLAVALVIGLSLLAGFHQVVHAGVARAAARDAAAHRHQQRVARCSIERSADQRALCLLTAPTVSRDTAMATASASR